ncbi:MAG: hypothetical protein JNK87_22745 [Bryobacterales bacterium]|nr:hypothetical protein [Bryobacterales bacterium]
MRGILLLALVMVVPGVWGQTPTIAVAPASLQFTMAAGGVAPASQQVVLTSTPAVLNYAGFANYLSGPVTGNWLQVTPATGLSNSVATINVVNTAGLTAGTYNATVIFVAVAFSNVFASVNVTLTVTGVSGTTITALPTSLTFQTAVGGTAPAQLLTVLSSTAVPITATALTTSGGNWLSVSPASAGATTSASFTVTASPAGLAAGTYTGIILVAGGAGVQVQVPVTLVVFFGGNGTGFIQPTSVSLFGVVGQTALSTQAVMLQPGFATNYTVSNFTTTTGQNWLTVTPASGTIFGSREITVGANATGLQAGTYHGVFTVTMAGIGSANIPVTFTVGVTQTVTTGLRFVPVEPCRMLETRAEYNFAGRSGAFGPPFLNAGEVRRLRPQDSTVCSIPAAAKAYSVNVTLLPRGGATSVRVFPAGELNSYPVPTISLGLREVVANATFVKAGDGGQIAVSAGGPADVLLDVNGYFVEDSRPEALVYYPMTPCRVVETRAAYRQPAGPFGPPSLAAGERRTFAMRSSPCAMPANARAYAVSLTAVPDGPLAFLSLVPTGGAAPLVSSLNAFGGQVVSNQVIVQAGTNGSIDAFSYGKTDVILDVTGYFAPDDGQTGLRYYPLIQCRTLSTAFGSEETRTVAIPAELCSWAGPAAKAYALNVTAIPSGQPMPFLTVYPAGQTRPGTSFLNAFEGQTQTNSVIVPAGVNGAVDLFAYRPTQVRVDVMGYFGR